MAMEISKFEWRADIKFLTKLKWKPQQILDALHEVYGDNAPKKSVVYDWIKRFKTGQEVLNDNQRSGRPSTSINEKTVAAVRSLVEKDQRISCQIIANEVGISRGSAHSILVDNLGQVKRRGGAQKRKVQTSKSSLTESKIAQGQQEVVTGEQSLIRKSANGRGIPIKVIIEHCKSSNVFKRNANQVIDGIRTDFPDVESELNPQKPRSKSFEVTVTFSDGSEELLWSGINLGPPRKLKFPDLEKILSNIKEFV